MTSLHRTVLPLALLTFAVALVALPAGAQTIELWSHHIAGVPPAVNGAVGAGEWPWAPQITIDSSYVNPAPYQTWQTDWPTYATFAFTDSALYILVDVVGDTTEDNGDQCVFWLRVGSTTYDVYIYGGGSSDAIGGARAAGFGTSPNSAISHRIYEFGIPLSAIGATVGQQIPICSPFFKGSSSMGFDASTSRDNIWPPNLDPGTISTWATLRLEDQIGLIPTLNPWGIGVLVALIGVVAVATLRRTGA